MLNVQLSQYIVKVIIYKEAILYYTFRILMLKILITGATGFVGNHLIEGLPRDSYIIGTTIENNEDDGNIHLIQCDITNNNDILELLKIHQPDVIYHLAAQARSWIDDPEDLFEVNFFGTLNILKSVAKIKKKTKYSPKIVFISSSEVYGNPDDPDNVTEENELKPINFYGTSKVAADRLCYQFSQSHDLNTLILRPFPHIGAGQNTGFFVPDMISQIMEKEKNQSRQIKVGNLTSIRDYSDVRDIVAAYVKVINHKTKPGETYNLSSGQGIKMETLLKKIIEKSGDNLEVVKDPSRFRPTDIPKSIGNSDKFRQEFKWEPKYTLDQTLDDVISYWRIKQ